MEVYKIKSLILILEIYLISLLPMFLVFIQKDSCTTKRNFIKSICICAFFEILIFSLIYFFNSEFLNLFHISQNIKNYSLYATRILFICSPITIIHYSLPIYLFKNEKKKKAFILFSLKIFYIPIFIIFNILFSTHIALFVVPVLDLIYSILFGFIIYKI